MEGQIIEKSSDLVKDPYVLEFLGLEDKSEYSENELETRLINNLQSFLLELGTGYTFVARQKRFTFNEEHFRVDLVFYNRMLRCFVLFDLKIGSLKHQDLGQMQMYVNYYDRYEKQEDENPTYYRSSTLPRQGRFYGGIDSSKGFKYICVEVSALFTR
mgnify:CR=1 FL=1